MKDLRDPPYAASLSTASGTLPILKYETMTVQSSIQGQTKLLELPNTAYVPDSVVSLASVHQLKTFRVRWNQDNNLLTFRGNNICQLEQHFGVYTLKFKLATEPSSLPTAFIASRSEPKTTKASIDILHRRLGHAGPRALERLSSDHGVIFKNNRGPATTECETCGISKMHKIILTRPSQRATRPFKRLHFDLVILGVAFNSSKALGHFHNEYTKRNFTYPLSNKNQATLIRIFKHIIFMAERRYKLKIKALITAI